MCWPNEIWPLDMRPMNHVGFNIASDNLLDLIREYLYIADMFDASNIYDFDLNIQFGRLNYLEKCILSKKAKTKLEIGLYSHFQKEKLRIDSLINPVKPVQIEKPREITKKKQTLVSVYNVKEDQNKKKYRSVLVITRTDTTGFEAMKFNCSPMWDSNPRPLA